MTGAAVLTARAAFRADAGYVAIAAPERSLPVVESALLEAVKRPLDEVVGAAERARSSRSGRASAAATARELVRRLLHEPTCPPSSTPTPSSSSSRSSARRRPCSRRTRASSRACSARSRPGSTPTGSRRSACVERFRCVVLLKGADTLIGTPGQGVLVHRRSDTPALATAGTGDVLTGIVAAFFAKGMPALEAAAAAAAAQTAAASLLPRAGLVAGDVAAALPRVLSRPNLAAVPWSEVTIDLGALRHNVGTLRRVAAPAEVWAVVKADAYGHGAGDVARAALEAGAAALAVATVPEALELRRTEPDARLLVMGPRRPTSSTRRVTRGWSSRCERHGAGRSPGAPEARYRHGALGAAALPDPLPSNAVALMSHLASADCDEAFTEEQIERFERATRGVGLPRHAANSAGSALPRCAPRRRSLRHRAPRAVPVRPTRPRTGCGGVELAQPTRARPRLQAGESTGYGRRWVASAPTWIGIVPVGYADGFRRDMTGTEVLVEAERLPRRGNHLDGRLRRRAAAAPGRYRGHDRRRRAAPRGPRRVAETITYEPACGIASGSTRALRRVVG